MEIENILLSEVTETEKNTHGIHFTLKVTLQLRKHPEVDLFENITKLKCYNFI